MTQLLTILLPVMFDNAFAIISADQNDDVSDLVFSSIILSTFKAALYIIYPLILILFVGWLMIIFTRRKPFMPRKLITISSTILNLYFGSRLLEDFADTSLLTRDQREKHVKSRLGRYRFGWFPGHGWDREWKVGVEREPVPHAYKFGQLARMLRLNLLLYTTTYDTHLNDHINSIETPETHAMTG